MTVKSMPIDRVLPLARQLLQIPLEEGRRDLWLWEHSDRVMRLTQMIAMLPEVNGAELDLLALAAAGLFHDAGWVLELHQGRIAHWQLLTRPTNDIQRELGAAMLLEEAGHLLPGASARLAADAIRHCNDRRTTLVEARVLAEAEALDEFGPLYVLRQFRQYQAQGRPVQQLVDSWQRQREYHYWEVRLNDSFRWEVTRDAARQRLAVMDAFMDALRGDLLAEDLSELLKGLGVVSLPGAS